jgi:hypothetical protein
MKKEEYMRFFERWIYYQFPRVEDDWDNVYILKTVAQIVSEPDELAHWEKRDCWSIYDLAKNEAKLKGFVQ